MKKVLAILLTVGLICTGNIYAYAGAGNDSYERFGASDMLEGLLLETEQQEEHEEILGTGIRIVEMPSESLTRSGTANISWSVATNVQMRTSVFYKSKGDVVEIYFDIKPADLKVKAGIVNADETFTYVTGKNRIQHKFSIKKSGNYKVAIQNVNSKTITAVGYYK